LKEDAYWELATLIQEKSAILTGGLRSFGNQQIEGFG